MSMHSIKAIEAWERFKTRLHPERPWKLRLHYLEEMLHVADRVFCGVAGVRGDGSVHHDSERR